MCFHANEVNRFERSDRGAACWQGDRVQYNRTAGRGCEFEVARRRIKKMINMAWRAISQTFRAGVVLYMVMREQNSVLGYSCWGEKKRTENSNSISCIIAEWRRWMPMTRRAWVFARAWNCSNRAAWRMCCKLVSWTLEEGDNYDEDETWRRIGVKRKELMASRDSLLGCLVLWIVQIMLVLCCLRRKLKKPCVRQGEREREERFSMQLWRLNFKSLMDQKA